MNLPPFVRAQLAVLAVAAVLGTVALSVFYLRVPEYLGIGKSIVSARFTDAARIYERAAVTFQGRPIGEVAGLEVVDGGVEVQMTIDDDARVPIGSRATVQSLSAIGEQYVDLTAARSDGPYLQDGDVIPFADTAVPKQIGPILDQVNNLLAALPRNDLTTVINESYAAFRDSAPSLQRLLDNGEALVTEADRNVNPTIELVNDLEPLLASQTATSPQIRQLTTNLASVTEQLRISDADIRGLLQDGQPFAQELTGLFDDVQPALPTLLANLVSLGQAGVTYHAGLEQILAIYPAITAAMQTITAPLDAENTFRLHVETQLNDPPPCTTGFRRADERRDPADTSFRPAPANAFCTLPMDDPSSVRGARNLPCQEFPGRRAASPQDCARGETRTEDHNRPFPADSPAGALTGASAQRPVAGLHGPAAVGPTPNSQEMTWQKLLLTPVGL
jgi:phospholipid/cholesterol/gamma-HCH transport system substrate-binding protein